MRRRTAHGGCCSRQLGDGAVECKPHTYQLNRGPAQLAPAETTYARDSKRMTCRTALLADPPTALLTQRHVTAWPICLKFLHLSLRSENRWLHAGGHRQEQEGSAGRSKQSVEQEIMILSGYRGAGNAKHKVCWVAMLQLSGL